MIYIEEVKTALVTINKCENQTESGESCELWRMCDTCQNALWEMLCWADPEENRGVRTNWQTDEEEAEA